jgi:ribA/ribD-fused uncharacterized protein
MRVTESSVFFWNGIYSQWYKASFTVEGNTFTSAEQYMMYHKALLFEDQEVANAIMKTNNPKEQKALGRKVRGFDPTVWDKHAIDIVTEGNYQKFTQNSYLLDSLTIDHIDKEIVEASPLDNIWGIGLHFDDKNCEDKTKWLGKNWLGIAIMAARTRILEKIDLANLKMMDDIEFHMKEFKKS